MNPTDAHGRLRKYNDWGFPVGFTKPSLGYAALLRLLHRLVQDRGATINHPRCRVLVLPDSSCFSSGDLQRFAKARGHITGPVRRYVPSADGTGKIPSDVDLLFVTVFAKSSATLSINSTTKSIVTGINQFAVPFAAGPAPAFRLWRNQTINKWDGFRYDSIPSCLLRLVEFKRIYGGAMSSDGLPWGLRLEVLDKDHGPEPKSPGPSYSPVVTEPIEHDTTRHSSG